MKFILKISLVVISISACADIMKLSVRDFLGVRFKVSSVYEYRGGMTTLEEAQSFLESKAYIDADTINVPFLDYDNVIIKYECRKLIEGEVFSGWGGFYGIYPNRSEVCFLNVFEKSQPELLAFNIEVLSQEKLLFLFDGFVYELEKVK